MTKGLAMWTLHGFYKIYVTAALCVIVWGVHKADSTSSPVPLSTVEAVSSVDTTLNNVALRSTTMQDHAGPVTVSTADRTITSDQGINLATGTNANDGSKESLTAATAMQGFVSSTTEAGQTTSIDPTQKAPANNKTAQGSAKTPNKVEEMAVVTTVATNDALLADTKDQLPLFTHPESTSDLKETKIKKELVRYKMIAFFLRTENSNLRTEVKQMRSANVILLAELEKTSTKNSSARFPQSDDICGELKSILTAGWARQNAQEYTGLLTTYGDQLVTCQKSLAAQEISADATEYKHKACVNELTECRRKGASLESTVRSFAEQSHDCNRTVEALEARQLLYHEKAITCNQSIQQVKSQVDVCNRYLDDCIASKREYAVKLETVNNTAMVDQRVITLCNSDLKETKSELESVETQLQISKSNLDFCNSNLEQYVTDCNRLNRTATEDLMNCTVNLENCMSSQADCLKSNENCVGLKQSLQNQYETCVVEVQDCDKQGRKLADVVVERDLIKHRYETCARSSRQNSQMSQKLVQQNDELKTKFDDCKFKLHAVGDAVEKKQNYDDDRGYIFLYESCVKNLKKCHATRDCGESRAVQTATCIPLLNNCTAKLKRLTQSNAQNPDGFLSQTCNSDVECCRIELNTCQVRIDELAHNCDDSIVRNQGKYKQCKSDLSKCEDNCACVRHTDECQDDLFQCHETLSELRHTCDKKCPDI